MAANITRTPAEAKLIIIGVLNLLGAVTDDADDIRRDLFDLDAMATIRRSGAVNVVGLNDKGDEIMRAFRLKIEEVTTAAGSTFWLKEVNGFPVLTNEPRA